MAQKLKEFEITYTTAEGTNAVMGWAFTRGAAIEAVTCGPDPICARRDIIAVRETGRR